MLSRVELCKYVKRFAHKLMFHVWNGKVIKYHAAESFQRPQFKTRSIEFKNSLGKFEENLWFLKMYERLRRNTSEIVKRRKTSKSESMELPSVVGVI